MSTKLPRKLIDLVYQVSGEWASSDPLIPVHLGDFGTLDETGQFIADDNIYSNKFQKYLEGITSSFDLNAYPPQFTESDQNYIISSSGVKREQLDVDKFVNIPRISSASLKGTWKFRDGEPGALLILVSSYTISIPKVVLEGVCKVKQLEGKPLVTMVRICPAYLRLLSDESGETISVAFYPTASGADVANTDGAAGWWTDAQSELLHQDTHPHGKPIFTPLFSLKQSKRSPGEGELESAEEYGWYDVYPTWEPLDEDSEESKLSCLAVRNSTTTNISRNPYIQFSDPYIQSSYPYIQSSDPKIQSSIPKIQFSIPKIQFGGPRNNNSRKFIDLIHKVTGKWTNWDPPIPVTVGAYGALDKNGEFNIDGNIYSDEFQRYLDNHGLNFVMRDYPPKLSEPDQDYIVASSGVTRRQFDVDQQTNALVASASIKGTWKFRDGKRGALLIIHAPCTSFIPNEIMTKILNVELLRGKYLVTSATVCPAYLMYLSSKSGESFSVAFCARTQGDGVNTRVGGGWWVANESALLRRGSSPNGEYLYTPLFTLKQILKRSWLSWRGAEEQPNGEEYLWKDVYPNWKPLDEDGEELDD